MANPNYLKIAERIKAETDPSVKEQLISSLYVFEEELTEEEKSLFGYWSRGYIQDDPGIVNNRFTSYVGDYFDESGNTSQ